MAVNYTQTDNHSAIVYSGVLCSTAANSLGQSSATIASDGGTVGSTPVASRTYTSSLTDAFVPYFEITPASGTTWGAGTWTVRINVSTANMNLTVVKVAVCRVNSSGVNQATIGETTGLSDSLGTTGVHSYSVTGSATTPSAGDMVAIGISVTNGAMSNQSFQFTPDQNIVSPFTGVATHATSGALAGQGAVINGAAVLHKKHATTGALIGPGALINGSAVHVAKHATSGALVGPGALIKGSAVHNAKHTTSGALTGQGSVISGSAARTRNHPTTGALAGQGALITGVAARMRQHPTVGALLGQGAIIVGSATRTSPAANTHNASGALVGQGSVITGVAAHIAIHGTSGALVGSGASISGAASRSGASPVVAAQAMILRPRHRRRGNVSF